MNTYKVISQAKHFVLLTSLSHFSHKVRIHFWGSSVTLLSIGSYSRLSFVQAKH